MYRNNISIGLYIQYNSNKVKALTKASSTGLTVWNFVLHVILCITYAYYCLIHMRMIKQQSARQYHI